MSEHVITVSTNAIMDRLRVLQSDLTHENRHTDAMTIDIAMQIIKGVPDTLMFLMAELNARASKTAVEIMRQESKRDQNSRRL